MRLRSEGVQFTQVCSQLQCSLVPISSLASSSISAWQQQCVQGRRRAAPSGGLQEHPAQLKRQQHRGGRGTAAGPTPSTVNGSTASHPPPGRRARARRFPPGSTPYGAARRSAAWAPPSCRLGTPQPGCRGRPGRTWRPARGVQGMNWVLVNEIVGPFDATAVHVTVGTPQEKHMQGQMRGPRATGFTLPDHMHAAPAPVRWPAPSPNASALLPPASRRSQ